MDSHAKIERSTSFYILNQILKACKQVGSDSYTMENALSNIFSIV